METLAAAIISVVAPYLVKGAEEFAKSAGAAAFDQVKGLAGRLRTWWSGDAVATAAAENFAKDPERYGKTLGELLTSDLEKDPALADELRGFLKQLGPSIEVVQKIEIGRGVTGADIGTLLSGRVRVEQNVTDASDVTGYRGTKVGGE
jgi:hypothetical protein